MCFYIVRFERIQWNWFATFQQHSHITGSLYFVWKARLATCMLSASSRFPTSIIDSGMQPPWQQARPPQHQQKHANRRRAENSWTAEIVQDLTPKSEESQPGKKKLHLAPLMIWALRECPLRCNNPKVGWKHLGEKQTHPFDRSKSYLKKA